MSMKARLVINIYYPNHNIDRLIICPATAVPGLRAVDAGRPVCGIVLTCVVCGGVAGV